jgi:hypothetical protein
LDLLDQTLPCCILQPKSKKSSHNHDGGKWSYNHCKQWQIARKYKK